VIAKAVIFAAILTNLQPRDVCLLTNTSNAAADRRKVLYPAMEDFSST